MVYTKLVIRKMSVQIYYKYLKSILYVKLSRILAN